MKRTMRAGRLVFAALAALALLSACGKSAKDTIAENAPAMQTLRAKLNTVVGGLPSLGSAVSMSMAPAEPKPVYDRKSKSFNTAFLSVEQLKDDSAPPLDLVLDSDLATTLAWTGPKNPMAESRLAEPAGDMTAMFETALKTPYVVIYRTASYAKPVATADGTSFDGGSADIEAFVVSLERNTWFASCRIVAQSDETVSFSMKKGDDPKARVEAFANSTLWQDTLKKLDACLTEQTGGTFDFEAP